MCQSSKCLFWLYCFGGLFLAGCGGNSQRSILDCFMSYHIWTKLELGGSFANVLRLRYLSASVSIFSKPRCLGGWKVLLSARSFIALWKQTFSLFNSRWILRKFQGPVLNQIICLIQTKNKLHSISTLCVSVCAIFNIDAFLLKSQYLDGMVWMFVFP